MRESTVLQKYLGLSLIQQGTMNVRVLYVMGDGNSKAQTCYIERTSREDIAEPVSIRRLLKACNGS